MQKQCTKCRQWKDENEFYKGRYECKCCLITRSRAAYAPRKEEVRRRRQQVYQGDLKRCRECGEYKPTTEYPYRSETWDGLSHQCKACKSAETRRYQIANPDKYQALSRAWYQANRDRKLLLASQWRKKNRDASRTIWHRYKSRRLQAGGTFTAEEWIILLGYYSPDGRCLCCGEQRPLAMDHVIPVSKNGPNIIANIQPLCKSCNSAKGERSTDYRHDGGAFARQINDAAYLSFSHARDDPG